MEEKTKGGLGIRDPGMMNLAMGFKLLWIFIEGGKEWWKEVIRKKYLKRPRSKCTDIEWMGKGT